MKFGMNSAQLELLNKLAIALSKSAGCAVYIFGSRAGGKHYFHSDVDMLYPSPQPLPLPPCFISQINEALKESRFPFIVELIAEENLAESYRASVFAIRVAARSHGQTHFVRAKRFVEPLPKVSPCIPVGNIGNVPALAPTPVPVPVYRH